MAQAALSAVDLWRSSEWRTEQRKWRTERQRWRQQDMAYRETERQAKREEDDFRAWQKE